jgi:hypothetical protein
MKFTSVRTILKSLSSKVSTETFERMSAFSMLSQTFSTVLQVETYEKKEALWDRVVLDEIKSDEKIIFVEYGVHQGDSIKYFSEHNTHPESLFVGLDSFEGLPEDWGTMPKGSFDVQGKIPLINDTRVTFLKGWFQITAAELAKLLAGRDGKLIVHYDADLYSSTLFALSQIDNLKKPYIAIFDEFTGHETRALCNYLQAFNADVGFLCKTNFDDGYPFRVAATITPTYNSSVNNLL